MSVMSVVRPVAPIQVKPAMSDPWAIPPLVERRWFWQCIDCARLDEGHGYAETLGEACDAGRHHRTNCPTVLERLLSHVLALPDYRVLHVARPDGTRVTLIACAECGWIIDDRDSHDEQHVAAADTLRAVRRG